MDMQPIFSPSLPSKHLPALPRKSCSFCGSVFVTDQQCESCGRQLHKDVWGAPGGEKSFYALKARYRKDVGAFLARFDLFLAKDSSLRIRYCALLKKRYLTLINHFDQQSSGLISSHAYLLEFQDLIHEMYRMKIDAEYMFDMLELAEGASLMPKLREVLNQAYGLHQRNLALDLWRHRIGGGPSFGFLLSIVLSCAILCAFSIYFFSFLIR